VRRRTSCLCDSSFLFPVFTDHFYLSFLFLHMYTRAYIYMYTYIHVHMYDCARSFLREITALPFRTISIQFSAVCNHSILEWIIVNCFLYVCNISFCMSLVDNFTSSPVDKFASTRIKSISSALTSQFLNGPGLPIIACPRSCNNCDHTRTQMCAIYVT